MMGWRVISEKEYGELIEIKDRYTLLCCSMTIENLMKTRDTEDQKLSNWVQENGRTVNTVQITNE